jgi:GNAT superfamily N-acetyltransferase
MRAYSGPADLRAMQDLTRHLGPDARWHIGELVWMRHQHGDASLAWPTALWDGDGDGLAAWAWMSGPGDLDLHLDPARPGLLEEILRWAGKAGAGGPLTVTVLNEETEIIGSLRRRGFAEVTSGPFFVHLRRGLDDLPEPRVPAGYTLRPVRDESDAPARAAVHRAAFSMPGAPSKVTDAAYARMMGVWPYRAGLDWLVEAPDGSPAAFCLVWLDEVTGEAVLEPVGTDPGHRRLGLASAAILGALRTARDLGAERARVAARGDDAYPSARATYQAVGFRPAARNVSFTRAAE